MHYATIEDILARMEPKTPPTRRYNRIVYADGIRVLELRDPNSGLGADPTDKPRHQYMMAGGMLWARCLPPESVGDEWADIGVPRWEPVERPSGILAEYARLAKVV